MIHVFFVPGMFGSTIEYVLRSFTKEYTPVRAEILPDGSMHSYEKEAHIVNFDQLANLEKIRPGSITTPIYPFRTLHLPEILEHFEIHLANSKKVLVHAQTLRDAEINLLFQYYKISLAGIGLSIFCGDNSHNIINWNPAYKSWTEMQPWELREWFSLFYASWVQEWIHSTDQVSDDFLKINNNKILYDTKSAMIEIIDHCKLTLHSDLDQFIAKWRQAQQYIIDEFNLLDKIIDCTINQVDYDWQETNIIAEAIIQQRLRTHGYEIRCDGLNIFPTNAKTLYNLLEKC